MSNKFPFVSCLCPTYLRPRLLENAMACFLAQDYPADRRELIILDDSGQLDPQISGSIEVVSIDRRFRSLPEKFNAISGMAKGSVLVVWEDDDVYLPWHISKHVESLSGKIEFSKPSRVWSTYTGKLEIEDAAGRFHASIAFTRSLFDRVGGWPVTKRGDFDQAFIHGLTRVAGGTSDPSVRRDPSYCFRWSSTNAYHGQGFMRSGNDETWYDQIPSPDANTRNGILLKPQFDDETRRIYESVK